MAKLSGLDRWGIPFRKGNRVRVVQNPDPEGFQISPLMLGKMGSVVRVRGTSNTGHNIDVQLDDQKLVSSFQSSQLEVAYGSGDGENFMAYAGSIVQAATQMMFKLNKHPYKSSCTPDQQEWLSSSARTMKSVLEKFRN